MASSSVCPPQSFLERAATVRPPGQLSPHCFLGPAQFHQAWVRMAFSFQGPVDSKELSMGDGGQELLQCMVGQGLEGRVPHISRSSQSFKWFCS